MGKRGQFYAWRIVYRYDNGTTGTQVISSMDEAALRGGEFLRRGAEIDVVTVDEATRTKTIVCTLTPDALPEADEDRPAWKDSEFVLALIRGEEPQRAELVDDDTTTAELVPLVDTAAVVDVDRHVSDRTRERIADAVPDTTRRAYGRQLARFEEWCAAGGRTAYPCTSETFAEFVSHLCDLELGPASIEQAMAAIRTQHRAKGFDHQPDTTAARMVLRAHRRERAEQGKRTKEAPPIVLDTLRAMISTTDVNTLLGLRDRALLVLGFALMGRRSELAALNIADVTETDDGIEVLVRKSKTDQEARGEIIAIPRGTHAETDPVRVLRAWLAALAERDVTSGRLLRSVNRWGHLADAISEDGINRAVRAAAERAGLPNPGTYSAHSLRAGGATAAYKAGAPISQITRHGRWADGSPTVNRYIRAADRWSDNAMRGVGL